MGHIDSNGASTGARNVVAFMNQDTVELLQKDTLARRRNYDAIPGEVEPGLFIKLEEKTEYEWNKNTGIISLKTSLQPNQAVAVY